jgi:hypothetical protein
MQYAPQEDRAHQRAMLDVELDMANGPLTATQGLGFSSHDQWQTFHDSLLAFGGLKGPTDVEQAYTNRLLEAITRDGHISWP